MRILVLSVGITVLTTTLLFVYFRNKMANMDHKVNLVLKTIQDHQQNIAKQDFLRQQHMQQMGQHMIYEERDEEENNEESFKEEVEHNNVPLIEVSDLEEKNNIEFSDSDSDSDSESESEDEEEMTVKQLPVDELNFGKKVENQEENQEEIVEEIQEDLEQIDYFSLSKVKLQSLCEERNISEYRKSHNKSKLIELLSNN